MTINQEHIATNSVLDDTIKRRQVLRRKMRGLRQTFPEYQQKEAAQLLKMQLINLVKQQQAQHIALYLTNDGELDPYPFIQWCWQHKIEVYLPVLHPFCAGHLLFLHYQKNTPMIKNKYGINEPKLDVRLIKTAATLDIVFTPLVAFDDAGRRLGMGGGYYDRTLAKLDQNTTSVIGLAYDYQKVAQVPVENWDVDLTAIFTPTNQYFQVKN